MEINMPEVPDWLRDIDEQIVADLNAAGVELEACGTPEALAQESRDTLASYLLREQAQDFQELDARELAYQGIVTLMATRHEAQTYPFTRRIAKRDAILKRLAKASLDAGGFGKRKSRETVFGTYGGTHKSESVKIVNPDELIAYAIAHAPHMVRVVPKSEPLDMARQIYDADELAAMKHEPIVGAVKEYLLGERKGLTLPGVEVVPEHTEYYAKPVVEDERDRFTQLTQEL